jgi:hypothetical protein
VHLNWRTVESEKKYYGTLLFYEVYFNDVDNIWLICDACNSEKSNKDALEWFENQWLYGQEFLDYLSKKGLNDKGILLKISEKQGLAEVAIEWFWSRHANYISIAKALYEKLVVPLQILNIQVDRIAGLGNLQRTERLQASLNGKMLLLEAMMHAKIGMPKGSDEPSDSESSQDEMRITPIKDLQGKEVKVTPGTYFEALGETAEGLGDMVHNRLKQKIMDKVLKPSKLRQPSPSKLRPQASSGPTNQPTLESLFPELSISQPAIITAEPEKQAGRSSFTAVANPATTKPIPPISPPAKPATAKGTATGAASKPTTRATSALAARSSSTAAPNIAMATKPTQKPQPQGSPPAPSQSRTTRAIPAPAPAPAHNETLSRKSTRTTKTADVITEPVASTKGKPSSTTATNPAAAKPIPPTKTTGAISTAQEKQARADGKAAAKASHGILTLAADAARKTSSEQAPKLRKPQTSSRDADTEEPESQPSSPPRPRLGSGNSSGSGSDP